MAKKSTILCWYLFSFLRRGKDPLSLFFEPFLEMPQIEAIEVETDDPIGPFGAKEAGEGTQLSPAPAIVNAIYDAIGVDFMELPITAEKILVALEKKSKKK
jgi:hypothetical protein